MRGGVRKIGVWLRDLSLSVALALSVILFLYRPVKVEGTSMMPGLENSERLFINKFIYRFGIADVQRGDTVVFWSPPDPTKSYIKRVIGLPGDVIEIREGTVYLNEKRLVEPYVNPNNYDHISAQRLRVPADHYYVMGDHRNSSNDSRAWGPVPRANIYGKAVFAYWPLHRLGLVP